MKVVTLSGTRPDYIRLIPTIKKLDTQEGIEHIFIWLGQNFDDSLSTQFFKEFNRQPDIMLNMEEKFQHIQYMSHIINRLDNHLKDINPDCVLTLGDTHATFAGVYVAKRLGIPVFHMEAGNRCYDPKRVPEEINRYMIDSIADWHLTYTQRSREHLLLEGKRPDRVVVVGNPIVEAIQNNMPSKTTPKDMYYIATIHRKENLEYNRLLQILTELNMLDKPVKLSGHPSIMSKLSYDSEWKFNNIKIYKPWNFKEFLQMQNNAECVITDSGTVPEEATFLHKPCVLIRYSTERPELLENGNMVVCSNLDDLKTCIDIAEYTTFDHDPAEYHNYVSDNVLKILMRYKDE